MRKIMERDQIVGDWGVAIPIKGNISFEQDELKIDDLLLYHENNGKVFAKTTVKNRSENDARIEAIKRVNRALDKIAFVLGASIRIETSGMATHSIGAFPVAMATESFTVKWMAPPIDEDTSSKAVKLGLNLLQKDYEYFQRSLSHYRNGLNAESDGNPNAFLDFWKSIEVIAGHYGDGRCLFSWDNVTESDRGKLIKYLRDEFGIKWAENAEIVKSDNDNVKTIHIFKDENSVEIRIDKKKKKAILINGVIVHHFDVKEENSKLNIYGNTTKDKIYDCFEKCFGDKKEAEVEELYKIRQNAAHGLKDMSDPEEIDWMIKKTPRIKELAREILEALSRKKA
jgi:hypothetical protein